MATRKSIEKEAKNKSREILVIRPYYYVLLLVDRSQSMLWPFLKNPDNKHNDHTLDYRDAIKKVQHEITVAHDKALSALRVSCFCKDRSMKVYQYAFNDRLKLINRPEELVPVGKDNVIKLTAENYYPESMTALYDVIHEALLVVESEYLKKAREIEKRIDKLIIGVITDGEDTIYFDRPSEKAEKISQIKQLFQSLRGGEGYKHLYRSVLIGLTSAGFTKQKLQAVKEELTFDEAISINQTDDAAIGKAFKLFSTDAAGI